MSYKKELYDRSYSHAWSMTKPDRIRLKKSLSFMPSGIKVLDVGCFSGDIGQRIRDLGNEVYGLELSAPAIKKAKNRISVIRHDLDNFFPLKDGSFDAVFAGEVIEHLFDVDKFLEETRRVLKHGGILVITTPNLVSFWNRFRALFGKAFIDVNTDKQHIRFFTRASLTKLLESHGFVAEKTSVCPLVLPLLSRCGIIFEKGAFNLGEGIIIRARKR